VAFSLLVGGMLFPGQFVDGVSTCNEKKERQVLSNGMRKGYFMTNSSHKHPVVE
jgi:hypothetical protein